MNYYREAKKKLDSDIRQKETEEQKHTIHMTVNDDSNFLSVFSANDTPVISGEVADFIEASTCSMNPREQLTLKIKSSCIDENEKVLYRCAIKEYYTEKYISAKRELEKNYMIAIVLAIAGILVLALSIFLEYSRESVIWSEVIDIVAWVFLWEAVDIAFLETRKLKLDRYRYVAYVAMEIEFEDALTGNCVVQENAKVVSLI